MLPQAAEEIKARLSTDLFRDIVALVPDDFLTYPGLDIEPELQREVYVTFLDAKLRNIDAHVTEAEDARKARL
jgi:hypothetical protein